METVVHAVYPFHYQLEVFIVEEHTVTTNVIDKRNLIGHPLQFGPRQFQRALYN